MYRRSLQYFYWKIGTYECLEVLCVHFHLKRSDMKKYSTYILKGDTSSGDMNEKVDHSLDFFENSHKKYIIIPSESLYYSLLEESVFITVWSPPGFINRENWTRYYLNATIQLLYFNVLFRQFILNIDFIPRWLVCIKKTYILFTFTKRSWLWRSYINVLVRYS